MNWDESYRTGEYKDHWDSSYPSPELAGFIGLLDNLGSWKILDIGCGTGEDAIFLSRYAEKVYGLDISPLAIKMAEEKSIRKGGKVKFMSGSVFSLPFDRNEFDLLTDRGCLHNLDLSDWTKYEAEAYRVLKDRAFLFLRGARRLAEYGEGFTFIESDHIEKVFTSERWRIKGPYRVNLFSDAKEGILDSNLFILKKTGGE